MNRAVFATLLGGKVHSEHAPYVVDATDPTEWTQQFVRAAAGQSPVFLANPDWGERERDQFQEQIRLQSETWNPETGWLMIPTGGSSGAIKLARHDQVTIAAAVSGMAQHFGLSCIHSLSTLPRHHVGGLMAWLRCVLTGGTYLDVSWRRLAEGGFTGLPAEEMVVSFVPTQLQRLRELEGSAAWLQHFHVVLVGGAALDETTAAWAYEEGIRLAPSYGATETAALAAALLPDQFLTGRRGVGRALPHLNINTDTQGGLICSGRSIFRGYWPEEIPASVDWNSGDLGRIDADGFIDVLGRVDALINSGGEKVNPQEVEVILKRLMQDARLMVLGVPDPTWGEKVVVAHADELELNLDELWQASGGQVARFKWPKQAISVDPWPVNRMDKIDCKRVRAAVLRALRD